MGKDEKEDSGFGFKDKAKAEETLRLLESHEPNYRRLTVRGLLGRAKRVLSLTKAEDKIKNIKEAMEVFENWLADLEKNKEKKQESKDKHDSKDKHENKDKHESKDKHDSKDKNDSKDEQDSKKEKDKEDKKKEKDSSSSSDVEMEDKSKPDKELPSETVPGLGFKDKQTAESTLKELEGRDPEYQRLAVKGLIGRAKRVLTCTRDETKLASIKEALALFEKFLDDFEAMHLSRQNNPYLSLGVVNSVVKMAEHVTEQQEAFIAAYSGANGEYKRLRTVVSDDGNTWDKVRNAALKELKEKHAEAKLFSDEEKPTKEHIEMMLWAYSPEPARVKKLIPETRDQDGRRKRKSSGDSRESPSKRQKE